VVARARPRRRVLVDRALAPDFAQPLVVVTAWSTYGAYVLASLGAVLAVGAWWYLRALARAGGDAVRPRSVALVVAVALAIGFASPVVFSSDVYAYAAYGDLAAHGADPYVRSTDASDPTLAAAQWQWGHVLPACVYGPFFVAIARVAVALFAPNVAAQLDALRILSALALLACIPLAYAAFAGLGRERGVWSAVAIGANPVAIWSAIEGHNDAIVVAMALAAFALARRYGPALGAFVATLSIGVKLVGAAAVVALLAAYRAPSRALTATVAGAAAGAVAVGLAVLPYAASMLAPGAHGPYQPHVSLQAIWPPLGIAAACAAFGFGAYRIARGEVEGWPLAALGAWIAIPNPQPWYGLWFLPIAALAPRSRIATVLIALSLTTFLRYVPDAVGTPDRLTDMVLSLLAFAPLALLWPTSRSHR